MIGQCVPPSSRQLKGPHCIVIRRHNASRTRIDGTHARSVMSFAFTAPLRAVSRAPRARASARGVDMRPRVPWCSGFPANRAPMRATSRAMPCARALERECRHMRARVRARAGDGRASGAVGGDERRRAGDGAAARATARVVAGVLGAFVASVTLAARASGGAVKLANVSGATAHDVGGMLLTSGLLLVALALFSMAETAITTLYPWKVRELADKEGPDSVFQRIRKDITRFLTTILIGTTVTSIMATALLTEAALIVYGEGSTTAVTVALTMVMLILCEIAPKSVAVQHATAVARVVAKPIHMMSYVVYPLGRTCQIIVNGMFALLGVKSTAEPFVSEEELKLVLVGAAKSGEVETAEKDMIDNILDLEETPVREVMTPLVQVHGTMSSATLTEFRNEWLEHKYSRVPVWEDRIDNVVGIIRAHKLMELDVAHKMNPTKTKSLDEVLVKDVMIADTFFVPESMSVMKLLCEFMQRKVHMAIVVNEYGGSVGLCTLEDCVEEIVGEIYDEEDIFKGNAEEDEQEETPFIREVTSGEFLVDTRVSVERLSEKTKLAIPESPLYETVGGFVCDLFGSIPLEGASMVKLFPVLIDEDRTNDSGDSNEDEETGENGCALRSMRIIITDADSRRVNEVRVILNSASKEVAEIVEDDMLSLSS